jgi:hypothetical protein
MGRGKHPETRTFNLGRDGEYIVHRGCRQLPSVHRQDQSGRLAASCEGSVTASWRRRRITSCPPCVSDRPAPRDYGLQRPCASIVASSLDCSLGCFGRMPNPSAPFAVLSDEGTRFDMPGILNKVSTRAVAARLCGTRHGFSHRRGPSVRLAWSLPILKDLHLTHPKRQK